MDIKNAALLSSVSGLVSKGISLLSVVIVARLLTPEEIGVFVIASSLTLIASEIRLIGINAYIIREKELTEEKVRRCIGLAILVSYSFGLILLVCSPFISAYYSNSDLQYLLFFLSVGFFPVPFTAATNAVLTRDYQIKQVLLIQNIGPLLGLLATVGLIIAEFSFYALAIAQAVTATITVITAFLVKPAWMNWFPIFQNLRDVTKIGLYNSGIQMLQKLQTLVPDLVLGRTVGPSFTAIFSRAMGLQIFIQDVLLTGINGIALSYLSRNSNSKASLKSAYLKSTSIINCFVLPPLISAIFLSESLIYVMFGDQWGESVFYAKLLGIWMAIRTLHQMTYPLLLSLHKEKLLFISRVAVFCIFMVGIIFVSWSEPKNIASVFIVVSIVDFWLLIAITKVVLNVGVVDYLRNSSKALLVTLVCGAASFAITKFSFSIMSEWATILVAGIMLPLLWLAMTTITKHILSRVIFELIHQHVFSRIKRIK